MKIIEVTYSFAMKVNLGNYESCDVFCAAKAQVDPDETPEAVYTQLREWVREKARADRKTIKEK